MEITVHDFLAQKEGAFILDVREAWELKKVSLKKVTHCPLGDLVIFAETLPQDQTIYVLCHHGVRSLKAALYLQGRGLNAISIKGGIDAYARDVDPTIGFY